MLTRGGALRAGLFVGVVVAAPFLAGQHWVMNALVFTAMYAALASAWNLVGGYAGYPSLGHAAFFGIGAYAMAWKFPSGHVLSSGLTPFWFLPVIGIAVGLLALPVAVIAMRTRADVFAIVTITLLFVVQTLAFNLRSITDGAQGAGVALPPFDAANFERPFYFAMAALLLFAMGISWYTLKSKFGLSLSAIRADEDKARGIGVRVTGVKLLAFSVSVGIAAMVGGVWAYYIGFVYPQFAVDPLVTIGMVLMTFLGGRATLWGPVLGALILVPAQQRLAYQLGGSQFYLIAYASVFLVIMLVMPRGIIPTLADVRRRRLLASHRAQDEGAPGADAAHNGVRALVRGGRHSGAALAVPTGALHLLDRRRRDRR
jgi:branched-chain amino acid transport system permease protein